jgi:hypothetical protein
MNFDKSAKIVKFSKKILKKNDWPSWFQFIYWDILYPVYWFFGNYVLKLKKIWRYSVYLWKEDIDFDYTSILKLLDFKLERMKIEMGQSSVHENIDSIEQIECTQKLIKDYLEDKFVEEELKELNSRFESIDRWEDTGEGDGSCYWLTDYKEDGVLHKDNSKRAKEISKMYSDVYQLNMTRQEECKKELFYYMAENIEGWWD